MNGHLLLISVTVSLQDKSMCARVGNKQRNTFKLNFVVNYLLCKEINGILLFLRLKSE